MHGDHTTRLHTQSHTHTHSLSFSRKQTHPTFSSPPPAPLAYEPFSTLAMIYEDNEDMDKALQFGLIAAHLNPSDCEEWIRLAEMSLEQDNIQQAIVCYSKGECVRV